MVEITIYLIFGISFTLGLYSVKEPESHKLLIFCAVAIIWPPFFVYFLAQKLVE